MKKTNLLIGFYFSTAISFITSMLWYPYPGSFILKAMPALSVAFYLFKYHQRNNVPFAFGFIFSAMGDIALDLDRENYFLFGLIFFLIAHLLYIATFIKLFDRNYFRTMRLLFLIVFALFMATFLWPHLGSLKFPVLIYLTVIVLMAACASISSLNNRLAWTGAIVFMFSDSMIAISKFITPFPFSQLGIMITYYLGNFLIGYSVLNQSNIKIDQKN